MSIVGLYLCDDRRQAEALEPGLTVLETLERAAPDAEMKDIKALLGRMMFSGKAMHKKAWTALLSLTRPTCASMLPPDCSSSHEKLRKCPAKCFCHCNSVTVILSFQDSDRLS